MRFVRLLIFAGGLLYGLGSSADARLVRYWLDEELIEKADLVVIARPVQTRDTAEHFDSSSYFGAQAVIGIETAFRVSSVLKGDPKTKHIVLHHYRADKNEVQNGPSFVSFQFPAHQIYRLFLVREADGRYAPVAGQKDADISVRKDIGK